MAENVEEIEAKLAAYVDGELTPAERVEIETHLANNPSHRDLLQDLVLHRNLLRSLPREKAPGDCTEGFQGQLERDILLGGDELTRARRRWRIQYSPQLLSAAAIILVAVALGIIVYTVLPPHQPHAPIAQLSTEPGKSAEPAVTASSTDTLTDARSYKVAPAELTVKKGTGDTTWNLNKEAVVGQKLDTARYVALKTQAEQQPIAAGDMMVITVTADDVKSANDAVVSYLALNKINYTAEADGMWKDGVDALAVGRRLAAGLDPPGGAGGVGQGGGTFGGVGLEAGAAAQVPALRANEDQVAKREDELDRKREGPRPDGKNEFKSVTAQVEEKRLAEESLAQRDQPQRQESFAKAAARPAPIRPEGTSSPTTQPTSIALGSAGRGINDALNEKAGAGTSAGGVGAVLLKQQQVRVLADEEKSAACVILARDMNGQQVRELARSLSQPERNVYATVQFDRSDAYRRTTLATLARSSDPKDHFLAYQQEAVQENELMLREKAVAANAPAVLGPTTRPAEQLTLNINPNDAGLTRSENDLKTVNGTVAANVSPSDYAFAEATQQPQLPGQQQALFATTPTTQPISAGARADLFTCVIVVQNNPAARAAGPATQPIAGKPTTAPTATPPAAKEAK